MKENDNLKIKNLVDVIIRSMQEKKAENVTVVDLRNIDNAVCDFFVISNANSNTQVNAIADSVQKETLEILADKAWHREGTETAEWILLDYVNVVVHIFQTASREFYALEELWGDAKITKVKAI